MRRAAAMRYTTADKMRMSAGIIGRNLAVLREMQSRFAASDLQAVSGLLLPIVDLAGQSFDRVLLARVRINIFPFVGIIVQVVELVLVFVAQTKFPTVGCDDGARRLV